jgi:hypothetical protein
MLNENNVYILLYFYYKSLNGFLKGIIFFFDNIQNSDILFLI